MTCHGGLNSIIAKTGLEAGRICLQIVECTEEVQQVAFGWLQVSQESCQETDDAAPLRDERLIATGEGARFRRFWAADGLREHSNYARNSKVLRVTCTPDSEAVLALEHHRHSVLIRVATGDKVYAGNTAYDLLSDAILSSEGTYMATGECDGEVRLWNAARYQKICKHFGFDNRDSRLAFSPDGGLLAGGSEDGRIMIWSAGKGWALPPIADVGSYVPGLGFSPDGRRLAAAGEDGTLSLFGGDRDSP
ncbi:WD40 repeat domain-containing protein [Pseudoponticoccus marisrubri]|uniref:WD40 repeat domain-containing protein n=1 Tax=Pseudoponticoccus marisrubri TaxID=1685382 RepID=UPI0014701799|nr:WD40 repeat domain-containing protein [Pseudoponticoccus marisrubri]